MSLNDIQKEALSLMDQHGLLTEGWRFRFDNAKRRAGCCDFRIKTISLSKVIYGLPANQSVATNTILHEIAHALVGKEHDHDGVWRRQARAIGCNGNTCSTLNEHPKGKYRGRCACGEIHNMHRMNRDRHGNLPQHQCKACRTQVLWRIAR